MKCKKILSFLLAAVMVLGLLPMSAMAADPTWTDNDGLFTDTTADPGKSYEYTVTGSDGSTQTIVVPAANTEPTGNSITEQTGTGKVYYQKVTDPANANGEGYLLVDTNTNQAVSTRPGVEKVTIEGDRINGEHVNAEWNITKPDAGKLNFGAGDQSLTMEQIRKGEGKRKDPYTYSYKVVLDPKDGNNQQIHVTGETVKLSRTYYEPTRSWQTETDYPVDVYLNIEGTNVMGDKNADHATAFTLFQKKTEPGASQWIVDTTGLDALIAEAKTKDKTLYEPSTWKTFEKALKAAKTAKKNLAASYAAEQEAVDALAQIDKAHNDLQKAMDALKRLPAPEKFTPVIDWQRTKESVYNDITRGQLVTELSFLDPNSPNYSRIKWDWSSVRNLTTDPSMTVWDYNTPKQYSSAQQIADVVAATWNDRDRYGNVEKPDWEKASVRKFAGTFTWPEGYTLEDKAVITSVNDANYQGIYDYINGDPELKARFGDKKVIPVNDDMYVYIYKDGENPTAWTNEEAAKHMVFWTGSSGKGEWSQENRGGGDWLRKTPATYLDKAAVPAYHGVMPNMRDVDPTAPVDYYSDAEEFENAHKIQHTDGWYTLVGTNTLMSTLNRLYPGEQLSGQTLHFDIYAFDNSDNGGMDQLEIRFEKAPATTASVTVKYWLNDTTGDPLTSTVINGAVIGDYIKLSPGTANNELNHGKALAITAANAEVTDGVPDYGPDGYLVRRNNNVINVIYTARNQGEVTYYTYDFGVTNVYTFGSEISKVTMETAAEGFSEASVENGTVKFSYKPQNAKGTPARAKLHLTKRGGGTYDANICVIPASNVLYEEDFITNSSWTPQGSNIVSLVSDNEKTVYGYSTSYSGVKGANGIYTVQVDETTEKSGDLSFVFNGIGLDLIGSCGPNYGTMAVKIMQGTKVIKTYVINTSFTEEIHQVPLLHANPKDLAAGVNYDVAVRGIYVSNTPAAVSTMSIGSGMTNEIYDALIDMGLSDEDMSKVEFVNAADNLPALREDSVSVMAAAPKAGASQKLAVDGFRVYRSTEKAAVAYAEKEQNLIYTNVMNDAIEGSFLAYVEHNGEGYYDVTTYEKAGGPENELYLLTKGNAVSFHLNTAGVSNPYAQVSLRAVVPNRNARVNKTIDLTHNTEMYYEIKPDENGLVTITNTGSNLLAIGNIKTNCPLVKFNRETEKMAVQAVAAFFAMPEEDAFVPAVLNADLQVTKLGRSSFNTLTVTASSDVDVLTVNGKTIRPVNKILVDLGLADNYVYKIYKRTSRGETAQFEIVAYNAAGLASQSVVVGE